MFGKSKALEAENAQLRTQLDSLSPYIEMARDLRAEIANEIDPITSSTGAHGDIVDAAYNSVREHWLHTARQQAYAAIVEAQGQAFMERIIQDIYDREADELYAQARDEISNNPQLIATMRSAAIEKILNANRERIGSELSEQDAEIAIQEAERITRIQRILHTMQQSGQIALCEFNPLLQPHDQLHIDVQDDDKQDFASMSFSWQRSGEDGGWIYSGYKLGEDISKTSGMKDKKIPRNVFVAPSSAITNPRTGESQIADSLILGAQLSIGHADGKYTGVETRELTGYYNESYDYDPATIAFVRLSARPIREWCAIDWIASPAKQ